MRVIILLAYNDHLRPKRILAPADFYLLPREFFEIPRCVFEGFCVVLLSLLLFFGALFLDAMVSLDSPYIQVFSGGCHL